MKKVLIISLALLFSSSAMSENWYLGGGAGLIEFDDGVDSISPTNIYIRGGYQLNQYFNIGIESSITISSDQISDSPDVDFDVDVVSFYVRGGVPLNESIWVYAQAGRANTELTAEFRGVELSDDDNDTMYGVGAEFDLGDKKTYLAVNYSIYNNNSGVDVTALNLGVGFRF